MTGNRLYKKGDTTYLRMIWEGLLDGNVGGLGTGLGPPIPGATKILAAPQFGDDVAGITDGVWHPALGDLSLSPDPTAINGIHAEAQSLAFVFRLPAAVLALDTTEAWDLKNIAGYARTDGVRPGFMNDNEIRGFPLGGVFGKAIINRDTALQMIAESRWIPGPTDTPPYPNFRLHAEMYCHRNPTPSDVFEPSLIVSLAG